MYKLQITNYKFLILFFTFSLMFSCVKEKTTNPSLDQNKVEQSLEIDTNEIEEELISWLNKQGYRTTNPESALRNGCDFEITGTHCIDKHLTTTIALDTGDPCVDCDDITVEYDAQMCWDYDANGVPINIQIALTNFTATPSPTCNALFNCWDHLSDADFITATEHFEYLASLLAGDLHAESLLSSPSFFGSTNLTLNFIKENCYKPCWNMDDGGNLIKTIIKCGEECCLRTRTISIVPGGVVTDQHGNSTIVDDSFHTTVPTFSTIGGSCALIPPCQNCGCMITSDVCLTECGPVVGL